ncbi:MAG: transglycosylase SLT domain-containing protein, partial [Polyangiaceae bacterium]|nr:transglycosylase SLT domain-containing protein [Polyangiaceae bacterium]
MLRRLGIPLLVALAGPGTAAAQPRAASEVLAPSVEALLRAGEETAELRALRLLEEEVFGRVGRVDPAGSAARGLELPPALTSTAPSAAPEIAEGSRDLAWLQGVALPDIPIRWDDRVVRYLELFRDDPRGRGLMRAWYQRLGRYGAMIEGSLERAGMPRDLRCVALAESGFDPLARSGAGAVGMWQFVGPTGAEYGLAQNHWVDQRRDPLRSTAAAAAYLGHLHRRLGNWELALAAYNMGYGALLRAIRKYNTNDYAMLSRVEAGLPFETTVYVAKILACSVVLRNPERFGLAEVAQDPALAVRTVDVPGGVNLGTLARAAGMEPAALAAINPELLRGRTPPDATRYDLRLPADRVETFSRAARRIRPGEEGQQVYVLRFGESLRDVASRYRTTVDELRARNEIAESTEIGPGTALLVPAVRPRDERSSAERPVAAVPDTEFRYEGRRRAFYRTS